jgi:hypothetical protein
VTEKQREKFRAGFSQARKDLEKTGEIYGKDSQQYKKAERALNSYGEEGVKNGVTIFTGEGGGVARTAVEGTLNTKTKDNPTGQDIRVIIDEATYEDEGLDSIIGHEGSHVADGTEWVKSGFAASKNPSQYQHEFDGTMVQSLLDQGRDPLGVSSITVPGYKPRGKNPYLPTRIELWNSGWQKPDEQRQANINYLLSRPVKAGGYDLKPTSKEKAFAKGSRF